MIVGVLVFDGAGLFETSVPASVFSEPGFDLRMVAGEPGTLTSTGGLRIDAPHGLDALADADLVIVPSYRTSFEPPPGAVLDALRAAHARGAKVAGLCVGAFVLAAAGLLDGRRAVTHWAYAGELAARYPKILVDTDQLYVDEGDIATSAGSAAGIDLCLHLIRHSSGAALADRIARRMVVPPHRAGERAQYIEEPVPAPLRAEPVGAALDWALHRLDQDIPVDELARRATMSRRAFDRRFRDLTGTTPARWLLHQRVLRAQRLLETTDLAVEEVARRCGFASATALRPHFRAEFGVAPRDYRRP
ncbi:helix-turn-helix domain-containing protein [Longispora sp. K20-0274]|uniref:GlxA family transcriptional regulator n=1 Tax=Longispora sp. K20-0274 TaxID=3088255 RepID=UPI00399A00B0